MTHNQGSPYDNEDWRRLIHAIVQTTSRGELQRASEHVKRWIRYLSRRTSRIARHMSNTSQSTQFNGGKTAYNAAASIFHAVFGKAEPQLFHQWITILRALRIIRPYLQIHETRAGETEDLTDTTLISLYRTLQFADNELRYEFGCNFATFSEKEHEEIEKVRDQSLRESTRACDNREPINICPTAGEQMPPKKVMALPMNLNDLRIIQAENFETFLCDEQKASQRSVIIVTSPWAELCKYWSTKKGCITCITCGFRHFSPTSPNARCVVCGGRDHGTEQCTRCGGGDRCDRHSAWHMYRTQNAMAEFLSALNVKRATESEWLCTCPRTC